jgi:hypothetical protein
MTRHNEEIVALPEGGQHAVADGGTVLSVSEVLRNAVGEHRSEAARSEILAIVSCCWNVARKFVWSL